jgi:hypothetical protein
MLTLQRTIDLEGIREIQKQRAILRPSKGLTHATLSAEKETISKLKPEGTRFASTTRAEELIKAELSAQFISQSDGNAEEAIM